MIFSILEGNQLLDVFQGISTLIKSDPTIICTRVGLIMLGILLVYLGKKGILEQLLMIPMGFGMSSINAAVLVLPSGRQGTLFVDPLVTDTESILNVLQVDWLQPIYTLAFSNGLIACLVFMGIGVLLDVSYLLARPFESMFLALCAELGTVLIFPIAVMAGLTYNEAACVALIGGADGPMVLYGSLILAKDLLVPITVVAYLYLGLTYGCYPFLIRLLVPAKLRAIKMVRPPRPTATSDQKLAFAVITCIFLSLLFPVAAPLFISLFLGVAVREVAIKEYIDVISGPFLYGATFFLGLLLGVLCEANTLLNPKVLSLLWLGMLALTFSAIGGLAGGYILYFIHKGNYNPVIGIAGVSCIPTTAKVAQKEVNRVAKNVVILPDALGANICGVITTAIFCGVYTAMLPALMNK